MERHNFRKWENRIYLGVFFREVRGVFVQTQPHPSKGEIGFTGRFYLLEEGQRGGIQVAQRVEQSSPAEISLSPEGIVLSSSVERFPTMRQFPLFPKEFSGEKRWQAFGLRVLDPDFNGKITVVPVYVDYRYEGITSYRNEQGHRIVGKYAVRYKGSTDYSNDPDLLEVQGTHDVSLFLSVKEGGLRFITETFKEEYRFRGERIVKLEGTVVTFFEGLSPDISPELTKALEKVASIPDIEIQDTIEGITLRVKNLRFKPDSSELLPEEVPRLKILSDSLKSIQGKKFLVVGHTADVGNPAGQNQLSVERAKAIVGRLTREGIPQEKLLYEGRGAREPIAPNTHEEGRSQNRRVEIIVLEE
ncbi:MAG: OmpA family protein [Spirochaetales bacterium]